MKSSRQMVEFFPFFTIEIWRSLLKSLAFCVILTKRQWHGGESMSAPLLLIADSNPRFSHDLAEALKGRYCVHCCCTGKQAMELLRSLKPEVLVLDMMLSELDGVSILQMAAQEGIFPMVLATTPLVSSYIVDVIEAMNVGYMMRQPCDPLIAAQRVTELEQHIRMPSANYHNYITGILRSLGFVTTHGGYRYLPIALMREAENPGQSVTKQLYPETGKRGDPKASGDQVEKLIRYAIKVAWAKGDKAVWAQYFPTGQKPTNSEFIARMAELLRQKENGW